MIDFHTHIIPNIDDGSSSLEESNQIIAELVNQGVKSIVLTPHYYGDKCSVDDFVKKRDFLKQGLDTSNVSIYLGAEVYVGARTIIDYENISKLKIGDTQYILIELPHTTDFQETLFSKLEELINVTGLIPVIAHAEKYHSLHKNPKNISRLIDIGCLLQVNTNSIFNKNKKLVKAMLKKGLVHCIGTDTHNMTSRKPKYDAAKKEIVSIIGNDGFENIQSQMEKMLNGQKIAMNTFKEINKILCFYI